MPVVKEGDKIVWRKGDYNIPTQEPYAWVMVNRNPDHQDIYFLPTKPTREQKISHQPYELYTHPKQWQSLSGEEFVAIAKSIWGDNLGMGDGYGYTVAWASSYATIEPSSKMLLLLQAIDKALREKNDG